MASAGADGIQALQQIQSSNDRVLERIRGDLYLSGTDVRDYLLEPEVGKRKGTDILCSRHARIWILPYSSICAW